MILNVFIDRYLYLLRKLIEGIEIVIWDKLYYG